MTAGRWDFALEIGSTFGQRLVWKDGLGAPVVLDGLAARMQLRGVGGLALAELTTENGGIVLGAAGEIVLAMSSQQTGLVGATSLQAASHTLEIVDPTSTPERVTRLLEGLVALRRSAVSEGEAP